MAETTGDFSWGSFARALAAQIDIGGNRTIAGKDTARAIAEIGLIESRKGGKSFAQLLSTWTAKSVGRSRSMQTQSVISTPTVGKFTVPERFCSPGQR